MGFQPCTHFRTTQTKTGEPSPPMNLSNQTKRRNNPRTKPQSIAQKILIRPMPCSLSNTKWKEKTDVTFAQQTPILQILENQNNIEHINITRRKRTHRYRETERERVIPRDYHEKQVDKQKKKTTAE